MRRGLAALLSGGAALTAGALVQAAGGLVAQLVLMRLLMPEAFGEFAVVLAVCGMVQMLLSFRLNTLIIRVSDAEFTAERCERYRAALVWETGAAAIATLVWLGLSDLMSPWALTLVAALTIGQWSNQNIAFYERGMAYGRIVSVEAGSQILGHLVAVAVVVAGGGAAALYIRELAVALMRVAAFAMLGALLPPLWRVPRWGDWRILAVESRALWIDGVLEGGLARVVVLGAAAVTGTHGTGIFAQSQRLATIPHQLLAPVVVRMSANVFSRMADASRRHALLCRLVAATVTGLTAVAVAIAVIAAPLVPLLLGEHWRPTVPVLVAMSGVVAFYSAFELLRSYCITQHRLRLVLAARLVQYSVFLAALAVATRSAEPLWTLALGLSATYTASFLVIAVGLLRRPYARVDPGGNATATACSQPPP